MRIDMGNFGNAQMTVANTQINRGNPAEMAEAKINAARTSERLSGMVNQAWDRVGGQLQQLGGEMWQQAKQLAAQKSALQIQDKQVHYQASVQAAQDAIDAGNLKAADVHTFIAKQMEAFKPAEIDDLDEAGRTQYQRGMEAVDKQFSGTVDHLYRAAHKVETRATTDAMFSNTERLALNEGGDLEKYAKLYDTPLFQAQAREAYGADFGKVIANAKANLYANGAKKDLLDNRDSYSGLQGIEKQFEEGGKYYGKLDPDQQLAILGQVDSRKGTIEAKAAAEAARQAARAQAQAAKQMAAENKAMSAQLNMREFIAQGNVPDNAMLEKYAQDTQGTSLANDGVQMAHLATQTQAFSAQPLGVQEQQLQSMAAGMRKGTNTADVKVYTAMRNAYNAQKKALVDDPVATMATKAGVELPSLDLSGIQNAKTPAEVKQANQDFAAQIYQMAGLSSQAQQLSPDVPKVVLPKYKRDELKATADALSPKERSNFYTTLANAGGRFGLALVKEVSGSDVITSAAYHQAAAPNSNTGQLIAQGQTYLDDKKSGFNAPDPSKTQAAIDDTLAGAVPAAQRSTIAGSVNAHYVASRAERGLPTNEIDSDDYNDSIKAVVGEVIQYGDGKVVVPANTDANQFRSQLYTAVSTQPDGANKMALIETGQARLTAVGAKTYMLTQPNGAPYIDPQSNQPVRVSIP